MWNALIPGYPYKGQTPFLHFFLIHIPHEVVDGTTPNGPVIPPLSVPPWMIVFDTTRLADVPGRLVVYELSTSERFEPTSELMALIDGHVLPAVYTVWYGEEGDRVLADFSAAATSPRTCPWFQAVTAGHSEKALRRLDRLARKGRQQQVTRASLADTLARYGRGYMQWSRRNLFGKNRDATTVEHALVGVERRPIKWSPAEHSLITSVFRKVFDQPFLDELLRRALPGGVEGYTDEQLKEGFIRSILTALEHLYSVAVQDPGPDAPEAETEKGL